RDLTPGATYFFTVTLRDRRASTLATHVDLLMDAFAATKQQRQFRTIAMVVLPDHLHALWRMPDDDADYPSRWRSIKSGFVRRLRKRDPGHGFDRDGRPQIWQARYWEHRIRDDRDLQAHVDYIHYNPVKHGHAASPGAWPYSTFGAWVRAGRLPGDWGAGVVEASGRFGE
ncbi:MAG TPA: transposase, partial [Xanthomonadaceae bacterium]|nr:transposase [Xanthomonadaceae bacterium]